MMLSTPEERSGEQGGETTCDPTEAEQNDPIADIIAQAGGRNNPRAKALSKQLSLLTPKDPGWWRTKKGAFYEWHEVGDSHLAFTLRLILRNSYMVQAFLLALIELHSRKDKPPILVSPQREACEDPKHPGYKDNLRTDEQMFVHASVFAKDIDLAEMLKYLNNLQGPMDEGTDSPPELPTNL